MFVMHYAVWSTLVQISKEINLISLNSNFRKLTTNPAAKHAITQTAAITGPMLIEKIATMELAICIRLLMELLKMIVP